MNREIKFRGWDANKKEMIFDTVKLALLIGASEIESKTGNIHHFMQFTGLIDKNGIEIYEGDVIHLAGYGEYIVDFPFLELYDSGAENDIGEILGNVYENPELIE